MVISASVWSPNAWVPESAPQTQVFWKRCISSSPATASQQNVSEHAPDGDSHRVTVNRTFAGDHTTKLGTVTGTAVSRVRFSWLCVFGIQVDRMSVTGGSQKTRWSHQSFQDVKCILTYTPDRRDKGCMSVMTITAESQLLHTQPSLTLPVQIIHSCPRQTEGLCTPRDVSLRSHH